MTDHAEESGMGHTQAGSGVGQAPGASEQNMGHGGYDVSAKGEGMGHGGRDPGAIGSNEEGMGHGGRDRAGDKEEGMGHDAAGGPNRDENNYGMGTGRPGDEQNMNILPGHSKGGHKQGGGMKEKIKDMLHK